MQVNAAMKEASTTGELRGILGIQHGASGVSVDFNHDPRLLHVFDSTQTAVVDGALVRVMSWYDNEWGFSNRMSDTAALARHGSEKAEQALMARFRTLDDLDPSSANGCCCAPT